MKSKAAFISLYICIASMMTVGCGSTTVPAGAENAISGTMPETAVCAADTSEAIETATETKLTEGSPITWFEAQGLVAEPGNTIKKKYWLWNWDNLLDAGLISSDDMVPRDWYYIDWDVADEGLVVLEYDLTVHFSESTDGLPEGYKCIVIKIEEYTKPDGPFDKGVGASTYIHSWFDRYTGLHADLADVDSLDIRQSSSDIIEFDGRSYALSYEYDYTEHEYRIVAPADYDGIGFVIWDKSGNLENAHVSAEYVGDGDLIASGYPNELETYYFLPEWQAD